MDYFNFSHLPLLVKEMIADEIVHNSIPEDRIQFATTCKAFNQLVKHAKPKKIIRHIRLDCRITYVVVCINSGNNRFITLPELKKILQQYQVENLSISAKDYYFRDMHFYSELMDLLVEPCRFLTALTITSYDPKIEFVDFYKKLRHLKSLTISDSSRTIIDLPYFPPKLILENKYPLSLLAEKTVNNPLSFLKITKEVKKKDIQKFLMTANLEIGAEIHFCFENKSEMWISLSKGFLTFIGNGLFEFEILRKFEYFILDQQMNSQNKKILKLSADFDLNGERIPFTATSASNPDNVVFSGVLTDECPEIVFENVAEDDFVRVSFPHRLYLWNNWYLIRYSPQMLDNWFPRTENYDPFERVKTINKTLGTKIVIIKPELLKKNR